MTARRLISALMFALVGSAIFTFWLSRKLARPAASEVVRQQQYVALVKSLEAGETLQKTGLKLIDWPSTSPVEGAFAKVDDVAGRTLLYPVSSGEPINEHQLSAAGSGSGLSTRIPDGMRAISLKTDQIVGVAGFLLPGTHVDVLMTYRMLNTMNPVTTTVLQDAQILAAGQKVQPDPEGKATPVDVVTLLVNPVDAERVVLASAQGTVHFVLRNGSDHAHLEEHSAQLSQLGGIESPVRSAAPMVKMSSLVSRVPAPQAASPPAAPKPYVVQTITGSKPSGESSQ